MTVDTIPDKSVIRLLAYFSQGIFLQSVGPVKKSTAYWLLWGNVKFFGHFFLLQLFFNLSVDQPFKKLADHGIPSGHNSGYDLTYLT